MKTEWLIANETSLESPARADNVIFGAILDAFWPNQAVFVVGEPLCNLENPSWDLIPLFRNRVVGFQRNACQVAWKSRTWHFGDDFGFFLANSGHFHDRGATLWCRNQFMSPNTFLRAIHQYLERLVTNVTAVGSADRAKRAILGVILVGCCFDHLRPLFWLGSHFVM